MADVHCRFCGEPCDTGEFHFDSSGYAAAAVAFKKFGCGFSIRTRCTASVVSPRAAEIAAVVQSLGAETDDWAVDEEDLAV